nr:DUF4297 domain-containing protein [Streptomyces sp. NBC_01177]
MRTVIRLRIFGSPTLFRARGARAAWGVAVVDVAVDAVDDADDFVHPIFQRAPGEDGGTDTSRLYRYQAEVAAQACLAMLTRDEIEYVVCEWHEDFAPEALPSPGRRTGRAGHES